MPGAVDVKPVEMVKIDVKTPEARELDIARAEQAKASAKLDLAQAQKETAIAQSVKTGAEVKSSELATSKEITKQALKEVKHGTFRENITWVFASKPFLGVVAIGIGIPIIFGIGTMLTGLITDEIAKSLGIDKKSANMLVWIACAVAGVIIILLLLNNMGKKRGK